MAQYGIENVRGGRYSQVSLSQVDSNSIKQEIRHSTDRCLRCGRKGHFRNNCYAKTHTDGTEMDDGNNDNQSSYDSRGRHFNDDDDDSDEDDDDDDSDEDNSDEDDNDDDDSGEDD